MTIQAVVSKAQVLIKAAVPAILNAPDYPNDSLLEQHSSIAYATNIRFKNRSSGFNNTIFDLRIEIKTSRKNLADAMKYLTPIPEAVAAVFMADTTIGKTCSTYEGDVTAKLVTEVVNGIVTIGYEITVENIKI